MDPNERSAAFPGDDADPTVEAGIEPEDLFECPACGGWSAYAPEVAEQLGIPAVGACSAWEVACGHCRVMFVERDAPIVSPLFGFPEDLPFD
jgi:hypothetical protein